MVDGAWMLEMLTFSKPRVETLWLMAGDMTVFLREAFDSGDLPILGISAAISFTDFFLAFLNWARGDSVSTDDAALLKEVSRFSKELFS